MPALSTSQLIIGFIVIIVIYGIFQIYTLKDKLQCTFIRKDRTEITKLVKMNQGRVIFDNAFYNIVPNRTILKMMWIFIFPTWIRCSIWKWDSNMPIDPTTWSNDYDNPADRKALDKTEDLMALQKTQETSLIKGGGGKKSFCNSSILIL